MASTGKKWAIGCGSGCLLVLLVFGGIGTCGYLGVKQVVDRADDLEASLDELRDRFGPAESYVPAADGAITAAQLNTFLSAREDLVLRAAPLADILSTLDGKGPSLAKIKAGVKLIPSLLEYVGRRGAVLLEHDVHPGEYAYLYSLVYFVWLEHDPGDGPGFRISGNDNDNDDENIRWNINKSNGDEVRRDRAHSARRDLNALLEKILTNQREALARSGESDSAWAAALDAELAALDDDRNRIAWQDGLPEQMLGALAPYRDRLAAAYSAPLNGMEMSLLDDGGAPAK